ncbi:hypothetical protein NQ314_008898 [Rhamnusium bicolor]|uniref:UBA domain-containing protein n=1 Tax=Rhamnusium bicolor TaxID=1586634 RepID=A0AAV8Y4K2_9CUCU|nr:hypothetical protein NQ314_008898 [Rhamnusium bicolor]
MSSSNRTTSKGGKGAKVDKSHKSDKSESGKGSGDKQHRDGNSKGEDPSIKEKVKQLIEMSQRSEEEVCLALHECDYDVNLAINMLFENMGTFMEINKHRVNGRRELKRKKNRQASTGKQEKPDEIMATDDWNETSPQVGGPAEKEKARNKSGGERQENERNLDDSGRPEYQRDRDRRGRQGSTRGGGGGRGRGGGRAGGRYPPRGNRSNSYSKPIETWDNSNTWDNSTAVTTNHSTEETWDDFPGTDEWSTEEYQGSLADTKVFTPSIQPTLDVISEPPSSQPPVDPTLTNQQLGQSLQIGQQSVQIPSQSPVPMVGTLTAAQTQYFSQLQQNSDSLNKQYAQSQTYQSQSYEKSQAPYNNTTSQPYSNAQQYVNQTNTYANTGYQPVNSGYNSAQEPVPTQQPTRTKTQRARVPPPSKIPASAVEMPGDLNSSIGYLDVQFGAMDLIDSTSSFEGGIDGKYSSTQSNNLDASAVVPASNLDLNTSNQNSTLDAYSPKTNTQSSISSALSQSLSNTDSIPQPTSEHLTGAYNTAPRSTTQGSTATAAASVAASGLEISKQPESHSYSQPSTYNSYQSKANTYNSSSYSGTQTTASSYVSKKNSVVSNIPPGVAPVMSTPYIMGQVPYFQQPVYSYEDMQLLQQRLPHMTTPYYDMSYQTPTTLAAVRDATLGNVGYSISDGRFTRGDNNASPVPSTLSQQTSTLTQGHQAQPILAGTAPPYFFATAFNTIAPNYQFGTMYTQLPAATNAHGSSNSNQYPKPASYGSGYGSYDALNQTQDYTKGGYVGNTQESNVNDQIIQFQSYEKQGFHSGTPPPFTGALHGSQNAGLAPSGTGYAPQVYIPTMAPHQQHHSTHLMQQPLHQVRNKKIYVL